MNYIWITYNKSFYSRFTCKSSGFITIYVQNMLQLPTIYPQLLQTVIIIRKNLSHKRNTRQSHSVNINHTKSRAIPFSRRPFVPVNSNQYSSWHRSSNILRKPVQGFHHPDIACRIPLFDWLECAHVSLIGRHKFVCREVFRVVRVWSPSRNNCINLEEYVRWCRHCSWDSDKLL
jgi:hypothetical protein